MLPKHKKHISTTAVGQTDTHIKELISHICRLSIYKVVQFICFKWFNSLFPTLYHSLQTHRDIFQWQTNTQKKTPRSCDQPTSVQPHSFINSNLKLKTNRHKYLTRPSPFFSHFEMKMDCNSWVSHVHSTFQKQLACKLEPVYTSTWACPFCPLCSQMSTWNCSEIY